MNNIKNNEIVTNKWLNLIERSNLSSPFQTPEFYKFFNSLNGFKADVFAIEHNGQYKALVVVTNQKENGFKGYFSRRGIIYGGPVFLEKEINFLTPLLKEVKAYYNHKLIYLETRNYFDFDFVKNKFSDVGFIYKPWLNFHLDTTNLEGMKKNMSNSRLRQVKKALKNGVEWNEAKSLEDVNMFYDILFDLYKHKIKKPLFPRIFFNEFFKQKLGKYLLVYDNKKVIGGIMCAIMPGKAIYEFYIAGLDSEYKNQYPSIMATWAAMEFANQNGIPLFDFMGAGKPEEEYGVREFKSRFGGKQVEYGRYVSILNPFLYRIGVIGLRLISKIK